MQLALLAQLLAILTILCSRFFRVGCALLALIILLLARSTRRCSRTTARSALRCCSCSHSTRAAALARAQVALVYACAATDKLLSAAWRSGQFVSTFSAEAVSRGRAVVAGLVAGWRVAAGLRAGRATADSASFALLASGAR